MSLFIVAIHSHAFDGPFLYEWVRPVNGVAVPVFFILSSMFYFYKVRQRGASKELLKHYLSRIVFFYSTWFVIELPLIMKSKKYFIDEGFSDIGRILMDICFRYTFNGSWFLSALALSIIILTICYNNKITRVLSIVFSISMLFYTSWQEYLPCFTHGFYNWWASNVRPEVRLTVLEGLPWVAIGSCLSNDFFDKIRRLLSINKVLAFVSLVSAIVVLVVNYNYGFIMMRTVLYMVLAITLVLFAGSVEISCTKLLLIRKLSTLFYVIHFVILSILGLVAKYVFNSESMWGVIDYIPSYLLTLFLTFLFSMAYLWLANKKLFRWLRYGI